LKIITSIKDQKDYCNSLIKKGEKISLIPTMGNLHKGHESLIFESSLIKNKKIVSLFINPLQFNNADDYKSYPKSIDSDIKILERNKVDCLFMPSEDEILKDIKESESFDLPEYMNILCGKYRDGHFLGVFKIVKKLFEITRPSIAYFGKKDYQQLVMIKYLSKKYFNDEISIISRDTIRENNGLAMSSRNNKLTLSQKNIASSVYKELISLKESICVDGNYNYADLQKKSIDSLSDMGIKVEYLELLSLDSFSIKQKNSPDNLMIFVAFYISGVRLIDNIEV
jgi:pantoate--beta-alanine ligase